MKRFEVLADGLLVGHSDLELGDPPMGCAGGRFWPSPAAVHLRPALLAAREGSQAHLLITVRPIGGQVVSAQGGVQILDYSAELGSEGLEIQVLGIGYPLYAELFPERVS